MRGLDQDRPGRIKAEGIETVAMQAAGLTPAISGKHEEERESARQAREEGDQEAEGSGQRRLGFRHDFMQGATGEAAVGQDGIDGGEAEGQGGARSLAARKQTAQFLDHGGTIMGSGKANRISHLILSCPGITLSMFGVCLKEVILEQNKNDAKADERKNAIAVLAAACLTNS